MKKISVLPLIALGSMLGCCAAFAHYPERSTAPDVIVQSLFHHKAQKLLLENLQKSLANSDFLDPFRGKEFESIQFSAPTSLPLEGLVREAVNDLVQADFSKSALNISMKNLKYAINGFDVKISKMQTDRDGFQFEIETRIESLSANAQEIRVSAAAENPKSFVNKMWVSLGNPALSVKDADFLSLNLKYRLHLNSDQQWVVDSDPVNENEFSSFTTMNLLKAVDLDFGDVKSTQLAIEMGNRRLVKSDNGLRRAVLIRKLEIARLILTPVSQALSGVNSVIEERLRQFAVNSSWPLTIGEQTVTLRSHSVTAIHSDDALSDQLQVGFDVDLKGMPEHRASFSVSEESTQGITRMIREDQATTVVSLSQDFVNRVIRNFLLPLLGKTLPGSVSLGPKGIFFVFEKGKNERKLGTVVVDVVVALDALPAAALGVKSIHFPLVMKPELTMGYENDMPLVRFRMASANVSDQVLYQGAYGVRSNIEKTSLPSIVAKIIRDQVKGIGPQLSGKVALEVFRGVPLTFVRMESDELGRLNLSLDLDPNKTKDINLFWNRLPELIRNFK